MKQYVNLETIDMFKNKSIEIMPLTVLTGVNSVTRNIINGLDFLYLKNILKGKKEIFFYLSNQK